jgi:hypothetical protein
MQIPLSLPVHAPLSFQTYLIIFAHPAYSFSAIIYCFLSTCLGIQIRRSDIWEAISFPSAQSIRERDSARRSRVNGEYELDNLYDRAGLGGMGEEEVEMMRRGRGSLY